jgi:hypothetical protein
MLLKLRRITAVLAAALTFAAASIPTNAGAQGYYGYGPAYVGAGGYGRGAWGGPYGAGGWDNAGWGGCGCCCRVYVPPPPPPPPCCCCGGYGGVGYGGVGYGYGYGGYGGVGYGGW